MVLQILRHRLFSFSQMNQNESDYYKIMTLPAQDPLLKNALVLCTGVVCTVTLEAL